MVGWRLAPNINLRKNFFFAVSNYFVAGPKTKKNYKKTHLRNKFMNSQTDANSITYNKQRNYCVSLFGQKSTYFSNLKICKVMENKIF